VYSRSQMCRRPKRSGAIIECYVLLATPEQQISLLFL